MNDILRLAVDHLREGVQVIGFDWRYLYLNKAAVEHSQRSASDLVGQRIQDSYPGIERTRLFEVLTSVMDTRRSQQMRDEFTYPQGAKRWFDLRVEPVPAGICVLSIDVSGEQELQLRLRAIENELQHRQKLETVGRLAGGIAHDFNNQLSLILGFTQMLLEQDVPEETERDLREIEAAAKRSGALTRQLLALSRRQVLRVQPVYLPDVVRSSERFLRQLLGDAVDLELQLDAATEVVLGDPGQLEHVITNLALNARDAMPNGGRLTISTTTVDHAAAAEDVMKSGRYSLLAVTDTGHGMDEETRARIFEPFFTTKDFGKGTGLGLAMVYGVVKQMGGFIWVDSARGRGTTLRLYFPVKR